MPNLNPDGLFLKKRTNGNKVNINRNFPWSWGESPSRRPDEYPGKSALSEPETLFARDLIRLLKPAITIWYHQTPLEPYVVYARGTAAEIPRRYARLAGVRDVRRQEPPPGSATGWQRATFRDATAFFVELPDGDTLPAAVVERHATAVLALARSIAKSN